MFNCLKVTDVVNAAVTSAHWELWLHPSCTSAGQAVASKTSNDCDRNMTVALKPLL